MFSKVTIVGAFAAIAAAQSNVVTFTDVPSSFANGQASQIGFTSTSDATPISITLRQGPANNLQDVQTLTSDAMGESISFTPDCLEDGDNYALQINQGSEVNFFGPFSITGYNADECDSASTSGPSSYETAPTETPSSMMTMTSASVPYPTSYVVTPTVGTGTIIRPTNGTFVKPTMTATTPYVPVGTGGMPGNSSVPTVPEQVGGASSMAGASSLALALGAMVAAVFLN